MTHPVLVEVTRGGIVESRHSGSYAVVNGEGRVVASAGEIDMPVFPRSAIKALQCLPVIESGAADHYGFSDEEIALVCSSHNGEPRHVAAARSMLAKTGLGEEAYECGAHWPIETQALHAMIRADEKPGQIHNNCSGKHAGMLAVARRIDADHHGYVERGHDVQRRIAKVLSEMCDVDADALPCGIDGCSVPTWAIPLRNLALGFARLGSGESLDPERKAAAARIIAAVRAHPFMVAGTDRFCTRLMTKIPRAFVKTGAEGVFCGAVPHAGLGIALKCDDGAGRASEAAFAAVLARLDVWTPEEKAALAPFAHATLKNWRKIEVGEVKAVV
ncbi:MAG: asparaginase [Rhizobiales bacterium]|nr:asparaginase [Hyphomicrobiales bacterium]